MTFTRFDRYVDRHARSFTERLQALCRMPSVGARGTGMRAIAGNRRTADAASGHRHEVVSRRRRLSDHLRRMRRGRAELTSSTDTTTCSRWAISASGRWGPLRRRSSTASSTLAGPPNSKGDLVARLAAVEAYQKTFGKLPVSLRFFVDGEDGLGSPSLYRFRCGEP